MRSCACAGTDQWREVARSKMENRKIGKQSTMGSRTAYLWKLASYSWWMMVITLSLLISNSSDIHHKDSQRLFKSICRTRSLLSVVTLVESRPECGSSSTVFFPFRKRLNRSHMHFLLIKPIAYASVPYIWTIITYVSEAVFLDLQQNSMFISCPISIWR